MPKPNKETSQSIIRWPIWITVGWLAAILGYGAFRWHAVGGWPVPNTVGDFLAGAFSPVAFFWLILGYRQQGAELRLQVEELRRSVEQQEAMAKAALQSNEIFTLQDLRNRRAALLAIQPALRVLHRQIISTGGDNKLTARFQVSSAKNVAKNLRVYRRGGIEEYFVLRRKRDIDPQSEMAFDLDHEIGGKMGRCILTTLMPTETIACRLHPSPSCL